MKVLKIKAIVIVLSVFSFCAEAQQKLTLEEAIAAALQKNFDIRLVKNDQRAAVVQDNSSIGLFFPRLNGTLSKNWNSSAQVLEFEDESRNREGRSAGNNLNAGVQLNWVIFDGMRMFIARDRFEELKNLGDQAVKAQIVNTVAQVINNYYNIVAQKQFLNALLEQQKLNEERVTLASRKLEVGSGRKPELLQARVDLNAQRVQVVQQISRIDQLKLQLNVLTGTEQGVAYDVADSIIFSNRFSRNDFIQNIENENPGLQLTRINNQVLKLNLKERRNSRLPTLQLNGAYNSNFVNNTRLLNPFGTLYSSSVGPSFGVSVTVPILNALETRTQIKLAELDVQAGQITYQRELATLKSNAESAFITYENALKTLEIAEENIRYARENTYIVFETFRSGIISAVELRNAQQSLAESYQTLVNARLNAKTAETELLRIKGTL